MNRLVQVYGSTFGIIRAEEFQTANMQQGGAAESVERNMWNALYQYTDKTWFCMH